MKNPPETWPERDPAPAPSLKTEPVTFALPTESALLSARIHAILPQTQCTRCGYADCAGYADALVGGQADLNQCAPGGMEGIMRLADVLQRQPKPLNAFHGLEKPRVLAVIEEEWCIGCTKCLDACPTDAILGASKRMHTVIDSHCTGCELCIPVCPVDCIRTLDASGTRTGWAAWSETQASQALVRYQQHSARIAHKTNTAESLVRVENFPADALERDIPEKSLQGIQIPLHSASSTAAHQKRALIEAAMQRARTLKTL